MATVERTRRVPRPERLKEGPGGGKSYKVISISLYNSEALWIDQISGMLKTGMTKKLRSLVVREAIHELQRVLEGKSPEAVRRFFLERQAAGDDGAS
jgi:hypothetical protein